MRLLLLGAALAILLAADAVVLLRAAANRRGVPPAKLELSDREFFPPPRGPDTSVVSLRLRWRDPSRPREWPRAARHFPRSGFAVFELQPEAPEGLSRLVFADTGTGLAQLRARYADPARHLIMPAVIRTAGFFGLANPSLYVPPEYLPVIRRDRFTVSLCMGSRNEPWICGARAAP
ncbi:MAG: hypothetical protein ACE15B_06275 [Bryobacteraceae bacterium]